MKKYKIMRIPISAYNNLQTKKQEMEKTIKDISGKERSVPMTRVIRVISAKKVYLSDAEVYKLGRKKKRGIY